MDLSLESAKQLRIDLRAMTKAQEEGDILKAYDLAKSNIDKGFLSLGLQYHMVLALARVGLTDRAIQHYEEWELHSHLEGEHRSEIAGLAARVAEYRANAKIKRQEKFHSAQQLRTQWTAEYYGRAYEDVAALGARLQKDKALKSSGADRRQHAKQAAVAYAKVYEDTHGFYVGINCAAMHLLAGDPATAAAMSDQVLAKWEKCETIEQEEKYLFAAMMLQAYLLATDNREESTKAVARLVEMQANDPKNLIEASTMVNQISKICEQLEVNLELSEKAKAEKAKADTGKADADKSDTAALNEASGRPQYQVLFQDALPRPTIIHYCGHMASAEGVVGRFPFGQEGRVTTDIEKKLKELNVGAGYGSLACGADILFAEALLRRGNELHVILPFEADEFIETSVRRGGIGWISRFNECLRQATSIYIASKGGFMGDVALFQYGSNIAMGQAVMRAEILGLPCKQVAVWDTADPMIIAGAGTFKNVSLWTARQRESITILSVLKPQSGMPYSSRVPSGQGYGREIRSFLFGDIEGFSELPEERLPGFWDTVIPLFADVIKQFPDEIEHYNTWGDGIYLVLTDTAVAADCALRLQEGMRDRKQEFIAAGLPEDLALRLGGHVGPVLQTKDAVHEKLNWCGTSIAKAARVEPVTRPGEVFVTEAFASILAIESKDSEFSCEYEGDLPSAKDYGNFRMYRLRRKHSF